MFLFSRSVRYDYEIDFFMREIVEFKDMCAYVRFLKGAWRIIMTIPGLRPYDFDVG